MKRIMLTVDFSYQLYRACAANPQLQSAEGIYTGGLYGFLMGFAAVVRETQATDVLICLDSKPYVRSKEYPAYKMLRKDSENEELKRIFNESKPLVIDVLDAMGVPVWSVFGFEADDLAGHVVRRHRSRFTRIYSHSNDSDLWQLLTAPNFLIYKDHIRTCITAETLLRSHGLTPEQFMLSTALQGTHNDIEGIHGVGPKTGDKIVKDPALLRRYQDSHGEMIERNLRLMHLPHRDFPHRSPLPQRKTRSSSRLLYRLLAKYDIDCTLQMVNAFEQIDYLTKGRN